MELEEQEELEEKYAKKEEAQENLFVRTCLRKRVCACTSNMVREYYGSFFFLFLRSHLAYIKTVVPN